jgi:hypothetical protein
MAVCYRGPHIGGDPKNESMNRFGAVGKRESQTPRERHARNALPLMRVRFAPESRQVIASQRNDEKAQQQTHALQHDRRLFLRAALDLQAQTERPPRGGLSVSVSPTMYQGRYQNPYRGKPWGRCVRAA